MARSNKPIVWGPFAAGGTLTAFLLQHITHPPLQTTAIHAQTTGHRRPLDRLRTGSSLQAQGHQHRRALGRKRQGGFAANAVGRAGDDSHLMGESLHGEEVSLTG